MLLLGIVLFISLINTLFLFVGFISFLVLFTQQIRYELGLLNTQKNEESLLKARIGRIIDLHCEAKQLNMKWDSNSVFILKLKEKTFFSLDSLVNSRAFIEFLSLAISYGA